MNKEDIFLNDWWRILIGEVPGEFYIEILIRIIAIYAIIMLSMRLMGKRMASQMNVTEFASLVSLAAAIGMGIQAPERGLLPALTVAMVIVLLQRILSSQMAKHLSVEKVMLDVHNILVEEGCIHADTLLTTDVSREKLFAELRGEGVKQLGEVKRFYMEASGKFTFIKNKKPVPGLSVLPDWDKEFRAEQQQTDMLVCHVCGTKKEANVDHCIKCGHDEFEPAVL